MKQKAKAPAQPVKAKKQYCVNTEANKARRIAAEQARQADAIRNRERTHARALRRMQQRNEETAHLIKACSGEIIDACTPVDIRLSDKVRLEAIAREIGPLIKRKARVTTD